MYNGLRILFITRKFPPSKGGMERVAYELYKHLSEISNVELIEWGKSNNKVLTNSHLSQPL